MIRLVVNADDLGLHPAIDEGILRAHRDGIVTSATALVTGPTAREAIAQAKAQGLPLGVHLCLTSSLPPAAAANDVPTVAPHGRFRAKWPAFARDWALGRIRPEELALELAAQVQRARALGLEPDHLDSHQHLHLLPAVREAFLELAEREKLPVRWPQERPEARWLSAPGAAAKSALLSSLGALGTRTEARVRLVPAVGIFDAGALDEAALCSTLSTLPDGDWELGCHPGASAVSLPSEPDWNYGWESELQALTGDAAKALVKERGIQLVSYSQLGTASPRAAPPLRGFERLPAKERWFVKARLFSAPLAALTERVPTGEIADVGCGHGAWTALLSSQPQRHVWGVDPDARKIAWARQALADRPNVRLENWTVEELLQRAGAGRFDAVCVSDVLYLLPPERWPPFLSVVKQLLKPGGRLFLKEAEDDGSWKTRKALLQEKLMVGVLKRTRQSGGLGFLKRSRVEQTLRDAGFSIAETVPLGAGYSTPHVLFVARNEGCA